MDATFFTVIVWNRVKKFAWDSTRPAVNVARQMDGDFWIWNDGRFSLYPPTEDADTKGCWHYNAVLQHCIAMDLSATKVLKKRWPWITGSLYYKEKMYDFSDILEDLYIVTSSLTVTPSVHVLNAILSQKLGIYIGKSVLYTVVGRFDVLTEHTFSAMLESEEDKVKWAETWV